jgi:hypothetical protein
MDLASPRPINRGGFTLEMMEPKVGFEPTTDGLRNRCSTPELLRHRTPQEAAEGEAGFYQRARPDTSRPVGRRLLGPLCTQ